MSHSSPIYERIKLDILNKILSGEYAAGTLLEPEPSLATKYGASRTTMRQALSELASEGYIHRVKRRGTVVSDLKEYQKPGAWVAMVVADLFSYPVQQTSDSVEKALKAKGLGLKVFAANKNIAEMECIVEQAVNAGAVGIIMCPSEDMAYSSKVHTLCRKGYPVCLFDLPLPQVSTDCAMSDNCEGGYLATSHLVKLGHREIAFISAASRSLTYTIGSRYNGYAAALSEAGIKVDSNLIIESFSGDPSWMNSVKDLLSSETRPSALFAANFYVATYVLQAASNLGLRVPDDLAVVGFDNLDIIARLATPLTTIDQPFDEIGAAAVRLLMERMEGDRTETNLTLLPPKLVVRKSCGASK